MSVKSGYLTTHILDTANGTPAANVKIELYRIDGAIRNLVTACVTNEDGRTNDQLLKNGEMSKGTYELIFYVGDYFAKGNPKLEYSFLDVVPIRFGVHDEDAHYHVPLLVSPFSFSTYRGS